MCEDRVEGAVVVAAIPQTSRPNWVPTARLSRCQCGVCMCMSGLCTSADLLHVDKSYNVGCRPGHLRLLVETQGELVKPSGVAYAAGFGAEPRAKPGTIEHRLQDARCCQPVSRVGDIPNCGPWAEGSRLAIAKACQQLAAPSPHLLPCSVGAALYATLESAAASERAP